MRAAVWRLEWRVALRRRRLLGMNVGIPLLLVIPVAAGGAPPFHAAAVYAVLFVLFGTFGSAIPLIREGSDGLLRRVVLAGVPAGSLLLQRVLAGAALDLLQLLPALVVILALGGAPAPLWIPAAAALALALVAANLVGTWVAAAARSLAEGALFAAVLSLFLLHASGVFRTPAPGTAAAMVEAVLPFGPLHRFLLGGAGAPSPTGGMEGLLAPGAGTALLLAATGAAAPFLLERITARGR